MYLVFEANAFGLLLSHADIERPFCRREDGGDLGDMAGAAVRPDVFLFVHDDCHLLEEDAVGSLYLCETL